MQMQGQGQANGVLSGRYAMSRQGMSSSSATASVSAENNAYYSEQQQQQQQLRNGSSSSAKGHARLGSGSGGEEFADF